MKRVEIDEAEEATPTVICFVARELLAFLEDNTDKLAILARAGLFVKADKSRDRRVEGMVAAHLHLFGRDGDARYA